MAKFVKFKTRKFWNEFGDSHFLTFSTLRRIPYLANDAICHMLAESIERAKTKHDFAVLSYVFMPDHVHLMLYPMREGYDMSQIAKSIKLSCSKKAKNAGLVKTVLWEPGGGFDENFRDPYARREMIRYMNLNPVRKGLVEESIAFRWSSANWYHTGEQGDIECHFRDELNE